MLFLSESDVELSEDIAESEIAEEAELPEETGGPEFSDEDGIVPADISEEEVSDDSKSESSLMLSADQITGAVLSYKTEEMQEWTEITGDETSIPGNASFRLKVDFDNISIKTLLENDCKIKYELPSVFRDAVVIAKITSGNENVGDMTVENGSVILIFDETWLRKQSSENDKLNGSFYVEAKADLSKLPENGETEIIVGNTTIRINFDSDVIAKYGNVDLEKTLGVLEETETGDYLNYTLTVTAGEDGCPNVRVEDSFTAGQSWVDSYVLPEDVSAEVGTDGKLVWTVGDMSPRDIKTLTYKIKLKDGYLGVRPKDAVTNEAAVYSGEYKRDTSACTFTPRASATMSKVAGKYTEDGSGGGTIQYTVWVKALDDNTYVLDNVTVWDALDGSVSGGASTDPAFLQYLTYDGDSFRLYEGGSNRQDGSAGLTEIENADPVNISQEKKSFTYNVGNLKPGECRTLVYTVRIDAGVFAQSNVDFIIGNRATILSDPSRTDGGSQRLENYNSKKTITSRKWARKLLGEEVKESRNIPMSGTVCDTSGTSTDESSFTIPAGSYQYQVVVNEAGDWDVSSAVMKDSFGETGHMHYVGYVRVDAYSINNPGNYGSDDAAADALSKMSPVQTVWVKIDQQKSFEFTPAEVGLSKDNCAYLLTYYAVPEYLGDVSSVIVANQFDLTGTVGINGNYYVLGGINVSASVTLQGGNYFSTSKQFWYYDRNAKGDETSANGALYWVIRAQGNLIPNGTVFKDAIETDEGENPHRTGTVAAAFTAETIEDFSQYENLEDLKKCTGYKEFDSYDLSAGTAELQLALNEEIRLDPSDSLYFVIATYPTKLPEREGASLKYQNTLYTKDPGENKEWVYQSGDIHYIVGGENIYKYLAKVFEVKAGETPDETEIVWKKKSEDSYIGDGQDLVVQKDYLKEAGSGLYAAWKVRINQDSTLSGTYRVKEKIPEGMDVVYIQRYSTGQSYGTRPVFAEIQGLTSDWKKVEQNFTFKDNNPTPAIYYKKDQEIIWDVRGLIADPQTPGGYYAEYLVVCKLTDSEVLLGGQTKTFNNEVILTDQAGNTLGSDTDGVELSAPKLSKTGTYDPQTNGGRYPFCIVLNELGTDLVPGADSIRLIDEMCDVLILDPDSIRVVNSDTNAEVAFSSAIEGNKLTLTLPDDQPLTITYEAVINAAPGQKLNISNNAHWEGYATTEGGGVKDEGFSYAAGATVGAGANAKLTVIKSDQYNNQLKLKNAEFRLTEMELLQNESDGEPGSLTEVSGGLTLTGTTDENGKLVWMDNSQNLKFNTIYCLTETKAPDGYVLDETPHYFVIAKAVEDTGEYPDWFAAAEKRNVHIHYSSAEYTYNAYNHKGEIQVKKAFRNADGSPLEKLNGTYTFGLYTAKTDTGSDGHQPNEDSDTFPENLVQVQTATVRYANNTVTPSEGYVRFTNVELGKTYYIYELDDEGKPIRANEEGTVGGIPFVTSYDKENISVSADSSIGEITVTNRMNYAELPDTGGTGTIPYTAGGAVLMAVSVGILYYRLRRRREAGSS